MRADQRPNFLIALNADAGADAVAPDWVQLLPPGPSVQGRDGRQWLLDHQALDQLRTKFAARAMDLAIDWEHAGDHRAPKGLEAPAAGWIDQLDVREGALWGHVNWTPRATAQVINREYRYLSPVFDYEPTTGRIAQLVGAGLTNRPNLHLRSLNQENPAMERSAALLAAITTALGLAADATDDALATAINQMKTGADDALARATNAEKAQPSLERYVPRADYDTLARRATNAENALAAQHKAGHDAAVNAAIDAALKAGKITPATQEYHRAMCADEAGLERFRAFAAAAPEIGGDAGLAGRNTKIGGEATALNAEEAAICRATGIDPKTFATTRDEEVSA